MGVVDLGDSEPRTLRVTDLPHNVTDKEVSILFLAMQGFCGGRMQPRYNPQDSPVAYVTFATAADAKHAQKRANNLHWAAENAVIKVELVQNDPTSPGVGTGGSPTMGDATAGYGQNSPREGSSSGRATGGEAAGSSPSSGDAAVADWSGLGRQMSGSQQPHLPQAHASHPHAHAHAHAHAHPHLPTSQLQHAHPPHTIPPHQHAAPQAPAGAHGYPAPQAQAAQHAQAHAFFPPQYLPQQQQQQQQQQQAVAAAQQAGYVAAQQQAQAQTQGQPQQQVAHQHQHQHHYHQAAATSATAVPSPQMPHQQHQHQQPHAASQAQAAAAPQQPWGMMPSGHQHAHLSHHHHHHHHHHAHAAAQAAAGIPAAQQQQQQAQQQAPAHIAPPHQQQVPHTAVHAHHSQHQHQGQVLSAASAYAGGVPAQAWGGYAGAVPQQLPGAPQSQHSPPHPHFAHPVHAGATGNVPPSMLPDSAVLPQGAPWVASAHHHHQHHQNLHHRRLPNSAVGGMLPQGGHTTHGHVLTQQPQPQHAAFLTLYVSNIDAAMSDEKLKALFEAFGFQKLKRSGSKAWISVDTVANAKAALKLDGYTGQDQRGFLKVESARSEMRGS